MAEVIHARHTAEIVPGADLVIIDDLGHFSIERRIVPEVVRLLERRRTSPPSGSPRGTPDRRRPER